MSQNQTHEHSIAYKSTKPYLAWNNMHNRCYNKTGKNYKDYGGRGIQVCREWHGPNGFQTFFEDMGNAPSESHSLDRINNFAGYSKANCRWATPTEQMRNRRPVLLVNIDEETLPITVWSLKLGFGKATLCARLQRERKRNKDITPTQIVEAAYLEHQKKYGQTTNNQ